MTDYKKKKSAQVLSAGKQSSQSPPLLLHWKFLLELTIKCLDLNQAYGNVERA